jgi:hypothetical protein
MKSMQDYSFLCEGIRWDLDFCGGVYISTRIHQVLVLILVSFLQEKVVEVTKQKEEKRSDDTIATSKYEV